ncbi:hypothetical protein N7U66_01565 [Lacinutrix neustonica]|uniref:Uncharacterized protein n=1 Tax=Lacinutrix neustonica TaxID=2980107 RepID=A0A9E8MY67_9FLAO|nr:hypothetical protein [Lacinutrix neustonica]WAC02430.1 hypothetical protein N7U66_01565 [Lacinutrix neustonica]
MKTIISLILFGTILFLGGLKNDPNNSNSSLDKERLTIKVVFNGFEGDSYFFTDEEEKAVQIIKKDNAPLQTYDFENGDYIGKQFALEVDGVDKFKQKIITTDKVIAIKAED